MGAIEGVNVIKVYNEIIVPPLYSIKAPIYVMLAIICIATFASVLIHKKFKVIDFLAIFLVAGCIGLGTGVILSCKNVEVKSTTYYFKTNRRSTLEEVKNKYGTDIRYNQVDDVYSITIYDEKED